MPTALLPPATTAPSGLEQRIAAIRRALTSRNLTSLYFLLPLMFQVRRWPMTLNDHYVFEPLYNMQVPERILLKAGRQLGKTLNTCASDLIFGATTPGLSTLIVCPRFEQSRRISNLNMRPLLQYSPVHELLVNENCVQRENQRDLANGAVFHFSFAFLDAERVRSISADRLWIDESVVVDTTILPTQKTIAELKRGDPIDTFGPEGRIVPSVLAKDPSYHGKRHCFRLTTASGKVVEGTVDHLLATSKGWMRIGEIIEYAGSGSSTQQQPARIQPGPAPTVIQALWQTTRSRRERELRQAVSSLNPSLSTDLCLLTPVDASLHPSIDITGLAPDPLVRIEYTGVKDVWDIETVGTHTYFANGIASHNCQDMNWDFLPLLQETLSGSPNWGTMRFSGTPKTLENTMERLWQKSSCAELAVRCAACNHWNIGSLEEDLLRNLGPTTTVCSKCGKVIDPRQAVFIHRHPARRALFPGYHISQPYHPFFFANPRKWRRLMANYRDYPFARFCNECLGESQDMASRLISSSDIKKACRSYDMSLELAARRRQDYRMTALAIDWGGGGLESSSYTVPILIAQPPGRDYLDVLFAARLNKNATPIQECRYIMELFKLLNPTFVCHDFTGAGNIREALLIQMGMPKNRIMPFTYVGPNNRPTIYWKPASEAGVRASYEIDKARSLLTLSQMFKAGKIRLPRYEQIAPFANDLLSLVEERNDDRPGADRTLISKVAESTDDFAHALNYGASGIWHALGTYPSLKEAAALEQDVRTMTAVLQDRLQVEDPGA